VRFYCVTPCLNAEDHIEETMLSVLRQTVFRRKDCSLYYVIRDGDSSDATVDIVKKVINKYINHKNIKIILYSEKDSGMYDALAKGFKSDTDSEVYSYINAGDYYSINAFEIVSEIFSQYEVYFLTGINTVYNSKSHLVNFSLPFEYNKYFLLKGLYGSVFPFVQQESTFWHMEIHQNLDLTKLMKLKYAGDFYLWKTFINDAPLYIVSAWLGGFKRHEQQLSSIFIDEYKTELKHISTSATVFDYLFAYIYRLLNYLPNGAKKLLSSHMFEYDHARQEYCPTKHSAGGVRKRKSIS